MLNRNLSRDGNNPTVKKGQNAIATLLATLSGEMSFNWSQWSGLNRRPTVYETVALPLSYIGAAAGPEFIGPGKYSSKEICFGKHRENGMGEAAAPGTVAPFFVSR